QTDDAGSVSSAIATVDVVAAQGLADELLGDEVDLVRRLGAAEHADTPASATVARGAEARRGRVEGLIPARHAEGPVLPAQGLRQSLASGLHAIPLRAVARYHPSLPRARAAIIALRPAGLRPPRVPDRPVARATIPEWRRTIPSRSSPSG